MDTLFNKINVFLDKYKLIIFFVLFFPSFYYAVTPIAIRFVNILDIVQYRLRFALFLISIIIFIIKKKKPSLLLITILLDRIWLLGVTYFYNNVAILDTFHHSMNVLTISFLIDAYRDDLKSVVKSVMPYFEILMYINLIIIFLFNSTKGYPQNNHYLLGYYNTMMVYAFPAIAVAIIYMYEYKKYIRASLLVIVSILTIIFAKGSTPLGALIAGIFVFCLQLLLSKTKAKKFKGTLSILFILVIVFNIYILTFFEPGQINILDLFITKVLNRSTTFTNRICIWEKAIQMITEKPLFGYGNSTRIITDTGFIAEHAHNQFLQILIRSGFIGAIISSISHFVLIKKVDSAKNSIIKYAFIGLLFGIFLSYTTEAYLYEHRFYLVFFLSYYLDKIDTSNKRK